MLWLVHHAAAAASDLDAQRPLTAEGRAHAARLARLAAERGVKPAAIWHSGKLRARQTAEAFWRECNPLAEFAAIRGLQPDDPPDRIADLLLGESRDVMLVGHMPSLPRIYELLTRRADRPVAEFPQHGVVALTREEGGWKEVWRRM